jgi:preprotein translocase subunit SecD
LAGFILSIGMAVDANVLIFERLKEELRAGRSLQQAIDLGWRRAWPSIRDSNTSSLITCFILFIFGSTFGASMVKGFSITLALGIGVSLFTAIIVTRTFLHLVLDRVKSAEHPSWFGL